MRNEHEGQDRDRNGRNRQSSDANGQSARSRDEHESWREYQRGPQGGQQGQRGYGDSGYGQGGYGASSGFGQGGRADEGDRSVGGRDYGQGGFGRSGEQSRWGRDDQSSYGERFNQGQGRGGFEQGDGFSGRSGAGQTHDERGSSWMGHGQARGSEHRYGGDAGGVGMGQPQRGQFAGKGPKGYRRSDERIREDVNERLTHHDGLDATEIEVEVQNGEVTLTGTVNTRAEKRYAEEVAEQCAGVNDVQNRLRVDPGSGSAGGGDRQEHRTSINTGA